VIDGHGPEGGWVADVLQNKLPEFLRASGDMREAFAKTEDFLGQDPRSYCSGAAIAVCHVNAKVAFANDLAGSTLQTLIAHL